MYLLDTNVISELRRGKPQASEQVRSWADSVATVRMYLSAVTLWELETGVRSLERMTPPQGQALRAWLNAVAHGFAGRILAFGEQTAPICAGLNVPDRRPARDAMIAATALEHRMTVVTRNVRDFEGTGVKLFNPWEAAAAP